MQCPEDRHDLVVGLHGGHVGHGCNVCSGMWLPAVFVESLAFDREFKLPDFYGALSARLTKPRDIPCPSGCGPLSCARVHDVEVDWCPDCRGVWFNRGELDSFLMHHPIRRQAGEPKLGEALAADAGLSVLWLLFFS